MDPSPPSGLFEAEARGRPQTVIIDQLEEAFTRPGAGDELGALVRAMNSGCQPAPWSMWISRRAGVWLR